MMNPALARVEGPNLALRLITPDDAAYVHGLRIDPAYNQHLSEVSGTAEDQRRWIEGYKTREAEGREFYYIIERKDGRPCGVVRLYDLEADSFTWGSWILDSHKTRYAAIEYQTKRAGKISYWPNGSVRPHYFPVFVREDEYFQEVPEVKIGQ